MEGTFRGRITNDLHILYDRLRVKDGWQFIEDYTFQSTPVLNPNSANEQAVPLVVQNANLDIGKTPGNLGAYMILRHLYMAVKKNRIYHNSLKGYSWQSFTTHTVPSSAVGDVYTTTIVGAPFHMTNLKKFRFNVVTAGITITKFEIKTESQTEWADLSIQNITAGGTDIDLESYFGTGEGFPSHSRGVVGDGIDIRITANNTAGAKDFTWTAYGLADTSQSASWIIQYVDVTGKKHNIGTFDDLRASDNMVIDRLIPIPITDPNNTDFGKLVFTPLVAGSDYYNNGDTYSIILNIAIAYMI